jgi:hypothetical protein
MSEHPRLRLSNGRPSPCIEENEGIPEASRVVLPIRCPKSGWRSLRVEEEGYIPQALSVASATVVYQVIVHGNESKRNRELRLWPAGSGLPSCRAAPGVDDKQCIQEASNAAPPTRRLWIVRDRQEFRVEDKESIKTWAADRLPTKSPGSAKSSELKTKKKGHPGRIKTWAANLLSSCHIRFLVIGAFAKGVVNSLLIALNE